MFYFLATDRRVKFMEIRVGLKLNGKQKSSITTTVDLIFPCQQVFTILLHCVPQQSRFHLDLLVGWFWNMTEFVASLLPSVIDTIKYGSFSECKSQ